MFLSCIKIIFSLFIKQWCTLWDREMHHSIFTILGVKLHQLSRPAINMQIGHKWRQSKFLPTRNSHLSLAIPAKDGCDKEAIIRTPNPPSWVFCLRLLSLIFYPSGSELFFFSFREFIVQTQPSDLSWCFTHKLTV